MKPTVLIVDDSLTVRMDLAEAFEFAGFRALPVGTAAEARALVGREPVSLLVLDVVLPDGDGVALLAELRAELPSIASLLLSTEAEVADRIRGLQTGADDYVGKPYDRAYVVARARELLREQLPAGDRPTVLLVEDSQTFRAELRQRLEGGGYAVIDVASGEEGLRLASLHRPEAIIVDGVLPGIDGPTVIRRVRLDAALRATPCLLLTAADDRGAELRALDAGADAFVRKDGDLEVILARLGAVLRSARSAPESGGNLGPRRILLVDDSETFLQQIAAVLRSEGYDVVLARSGEQALELLSVQAVDCVLLDLVMPGLGGKETCRRLKEIPALREFPVIMVTSVEDRGAMIEGLALGADDFIAKSSEFEVLKARVRAQIRRKEFEDEHRRIQRELLRSELEAAEARAARQVAEAQASLALARASMAEELERKNRELEAFSYSVSHDLRAPLRSIEGFSRVLEEDAQGLDARGRDCLRRVRLAAQRMNELIDDLLLLSRVTRGELHREALDLSELAQVVGGELARREPGRTVELQVHGPLLAQADHRLVRVLLDNLLGNAWKFTAKTSAARVEVGRRDDRERGVVFFVKDNGAGFDMTYADRLFTPFQRLHGSDDFPGTGIGLATVQRIVDRHGGRVWAEGEVGRGATILFTLSAPVETRSGRGSP